MVIVTGSFLSPILSQENDEWKTITIIVQFFPAVTNDFLFHIRFATVWFGSSRLTVAGSFTFPFLPNRRPSAVGRERMVDETGGPSLRWLLPGFLCFPSVKVHPCHPSRYAYHPPPLPPLFTLFVRHSLRNAVEDERSERMTYGEKGWAWWWMGRLTGDGRIKKQVRRRDESRTC